MAGFAFAVDETGARTTQSRPAGMDAYPGLLDDPARRELPMTRDARRDDARSARRRIDLRAGGHRHRGLSGPRCAPSQRCAFSRRSPPLATPRSRACRPRTTRRCTRSSTCAPAAQVTARWWRRRSACRASPPSATAGGAGHSGTIGNEPDGGSDRTVALPGDAAPHRYRPPPPWEVADAWTATRRAWSEPAGFGLIEVMVGMVIALLTMLAVHRVVIASETMRRNAQSDAEAQQAAQFALARLSFDRRQCRCRNRHGCARTGACP